jgi:hypothetical protein
MPLKLLMPMLRAREYQSVASEAAFAGRAGAAAASADLLPQPRLSLPARRVKLFRF